MPVEELEAALARGADPAAVNFLSKRGNDARLYVVREYGWIRTAKQAWNMWSFDDKCAEIARSAKEYWASQYTLNEYDTLDIHEFKSGDRFTVRAKALLEGGKPRVLKNLAMGFSEAASEKIEPMYSTAKYSELEREKLYRRVGGNPE